MTSSDIHAAGLRDPRVREAYAACSAFLRHRNSAAYPKAKLLLPPAQRPYWDAVIAFTTYVDDIIDDPQVAVADRVAAYTAYATAFNALLDGDDPWPAPAEAGHELVGRQLAQAFAHFTRTWDVSRESVQRFMDTIATDLAVTQYASFAELERYLDGVCAQGTLWVNAMMTPPQRRTKEADERAVSASFGLQLTDFLLDLPEDIADGRFYLPLEDQQAFGLGPAELAEAARSRRMTEQLRELVRFEAERARDYFAHAAGWWPLVPASARELPRQYVRLGQYSLEEIVKSGYDVFNIGRRAKLASMTASGASFAAGYLRARTAHVVGRAAVNTPPHR